MHLFDLNTIEISLEWPGPALLRAVAGGDIRVVGQFVAEIENTRKYRFVTRIVNKAYEN